ncbi:MAG: hypothetical protein KGH54_00255 [Candidatus Micrarchaeota archaeon]|nr:hypothetical protein [Candidatus Micrarchaeota archaeon]
MNKRIVIIGVILILLAFVAGIALTPNTFTSIANTSLMNISVAQGGNSYVPFVVGANGLVSVIYNSNARLDFYFANSTAFKTLGAYKNSSLTLSQWARNLYGNGVYEIVPNSANGIFPNFAPTNSSLNYSHANQSLFPFAAGTYYALFENLGNQSANIQMISSISDSARVASGFSQVIKIGVAFFAALLAGIILIIYGILKKPKEAPVEPAAADQKKVDEMYRDVEKKKPKGRK